MRMLRRVSGTTLEDKNECILKKLKVSLIEMILVCAMENNKCAHLGDMLS